MNTTTTTTAPVRDTETEITTLLTGHGGATGHARRSGDTWPWKVPHPRGGYLVVEIGLRPRWCSIGVDPWHTTDRREQVGAFGLRARRIRRVRW